MPSKIVEIRRTNHNAPIWEKGNKELDDWLNPTVQGINVRHESRTKPVPYTGLTQKELKFLLPLIVDIDTKGDDYFEFNKRKKEYYNRLMAFPSHGGMKLEVGLKTDNKKEADNEENEPINIDHYIKWKALFENDPRVAHSEEEAMSHIQYQFYIVDEDKKEEQEEQFQLIKDDAMMHYFTIKDSLKELRKFIILMDEGTVLHSDEKDVPKLRVRLSKLIEADPKRFYTIFTDVDSDYNYKIQQLLNYGVLEIRPGGAYYDKESTKQIATNKPAMVKYVKDAANTEVMAQLTRRLQEKSKAPL